MNPAIASTQALRRLLDVQLSVWPEHEKFLALRFRSADIEIADRIAEMVLRLVDDPAVLAEDYRWLCGLLYDEELHLRRTGNYRLARFEDAAREVYSNHEFMRRYMNGLLISQVWWENHSRVIDYYSRVFLSQNEMGYSHLEIGPGHGLLLYFAAQDPRAGTVTGWDLSDSSLLATRAALGRLATSKDVRLEKRNLFDAPSAQERYDSIVLSEVCEHLENPEEALASIKQHLAPKGRLFVNVPVNSPAPDHIYLLRTPEEAVQMVENAGYEVVDQCFFPVSGRTEAQARKLQLTISCVIVGTVRA
jgi:2-polyprenyl-3-methyl-5-hydroxy-6-metoxy-1,4-benzoquinol methylase